ncbi:dihydrofolate reductase family protein [Paenibacillus allorhizoplanae]|uniref:dihydrofolate reductase family protein n=1 Tax=Paenibacillus allorhizoplanae TaxID=2905648 RepID=UPI0030B891E5
MRNRRRSKHEKTRIVHACVDGRVCVGFERRTRLDSVQRLKEQPGKNLVIFGSPGAAKTLLELGLIDEFQLTICPVILGGGKSAFHGDGEKIRLKLLSSRTLKSGIIAARYELEK